MKLTSSNTRNIDQYADIHRHDSNYGRSSEGLCRTISHYAREIAPQKILDFGCGKSKVVECVAQNLGAQAFKYDPAIPEFAELPVVEADIVINTDVLEHLDESEIPLLLADIRSISRSAFFNISTRKAAKILSSGENAHSTVRPSDWWVSQLSNYFSVCHKLPSPADEARFITWEPSYKTTLFAWLRRL